VLLIGPLSVGQPLRKFGLTFTLAMALGLAASAAVQARSWVGPGARSEQADVSLADLPAEARQTERLIRAGGPFPYGKDGIVFGNRERQLSPAPRGYYREYTVPSPGARNRGARRIVCGGRQPREPDACFYTEDHYTSFHRIVP
jgi:ribonuclease T1